MTQKQYKTGFALSGGGIRGLCHAGVLKALEEHQIYPDILSGVSAGAVVGALYADGYSPDAIKAHFHDVSFRKMTKITVPEGGLFRIDAFEDFLSKTLRAKTFEELRLPLRIVATNLDTGKSTIFEKGNLIEAIVASCSIPVLFSPKKINGVNFVDGGVLKNFPVSILQPDCNYIIGVNASPLVADKYKLSIKNVAFRTYHFMFRSNTLPDRELCDLLIEPPHIGNYEIFEVEKADEIFETGYRAAKEILNSRKNQNS